VSLRFVAPKRDSVQSEPSRFGNRSLPRAVARRGAAFAFRRKPRLVAATARDQTGGSVTPAFQKGALPLHGSLDQRQATATPIERPASPTSAPRASSANRVRYRFAELSSRYLGISQRAFDALQPPRRSRWRENCWQFCICAGRKRSDSAGAPALSTAAVAPKSPYTDGCLATS
jgi:hypothetical protein